MSNADEILSSDKLPNYYHFNSHRRWFPIFFSLIQIIHSTTIITTILYNHIVVEKFLWLMPKKLDFFSSSCPWIKSNSSIEIMTFFQEDTIGIQVLNQQFYMTILLYSKKSRDLMGCNHCTVRFSGKLHTVRCEKTDDKNCLFCKPTTKNLNNKMGGGW